MANTIDWGKIYETTNFGSGRTDNTIDWGITYKDLGGGAATTPLLDDYANAVVGYSLRKLRSDYTGYAIRVTPDGATFTDIGFDGDGNLDTASLPSDSELLVSTWYDQVGTKNLVQTSIAAMPRIKISGSVVEVNGKPSVDFNQGRTMTISTSIANQVDITSKNLTQLMVIDSDADFGSSLREYFLMGGTSSNGRVYLNAANNFRVQSGGQTFSYTATYSPALNDPNIFVITHGDVGGNVKLYQNGTQPATNATTITGTGDHEMWRIAGTVSIHVSTVKFSEYVLWNVDYDSSASDLNTAVNNYYGTYA